MEEIGDFIIRQCMVGLVDPPVRGSPDSLSKIWTRFKPIPKALLPSSAFMYLD